MNYELHGTTISDPYRSLEDLDSPETRAWVEAQNARTFEFLNSIPQRQQIRGRINELSDYERCGIPFKEGNRYFFLKNDGLQNQSVLYTMDRLDATPRMLLDPNALSTDGTIALTSTAVSRDGKLMAYGLSRKGSDWEEWRVRDVSTGEDLSDRLEWLKFSTASWTEDGKGFFYCRYDEPKPGDEYEEQNYFQKLYYHRLGTPQSSDELVYYRPDQREWNYGPLVTDDGRYLVFVVWAATDHTLIFHRDLHSSSPVVELISEFKARYEFVGNDGPRFWLLTDEGAPRGRVIEIDTVTGELKEIIAESLQTLEQVTVVGEHFLSKYLHDAHTRVKVSDRHGSFVREVELPGMGTATGFSGRQDDPETFFDFASFITPTTIYRYDVATGATSLFHKPPLRFNPADFETRQVFVNSKDGARFPMFISFRRGLKQDGMNPAELYGYGGFNVSVTPAFSVSRIVWMEMGGVFAVANIRGGGEYGKDWHEAGTKTRKQNVFDDFIAAAEWLVESRYTKPSKLAISGRSNGGLLVGACITQRPDLFGAAVPGVGVMDMLRFHKFTIGWSWVSDYGSPDNPEEFKALHAYSPYHRIRTGVRYPATLVTTGDHDDRVVPGHSYKFAAALQAAQVGTAPILIRIDVSAGHGLGKPVTKQIDEAADTISFLVKVLA